MIIRMSIRAKTYNINHTMINKKTSKRKIGSNKTYNIELDMDIKQHSLRVKIFNCKKLNSNLLVCQIVLKVKLTMIFSNI